MIYFFFPDSEQMPKGVEGIEEFVHPLLWTKTV